MALSDDVNRIAAAATEHAGPGEEVAAVLPVESLPGDRQYLCAFVGEDETQSWILLDDTGSPVRSRDRVRDAASIAALCEVAEEAVSITLGEEPRVASAAYLDSVAGRGDVAVALQGALPVVDELTRDIEANYKLELS